MGELTASYASLMGKHASNVKKSNMASRQASAAVRKLEVSTKLAKAKSEESVAEARAAARTSRRG